MASRTNTQGDVRGNIAHDASDSINDSDDWELISLPEGPSVNVNPTRNAFLDFQLNGRFGQLSFVIRPSATVNRANAGLENFGTIHEQEQSLLFRLPVEIRLYIYELLLRIPTTGSGVKLARLPAYEHSRSVLTVLSTCRRILAEAEGIFYTINRLSVNDPQFWHSIGFRRRTAITMFALPADSTGSTLAGLKQLHFAPNLKSLYLLRQSSIKYTDVSSWAVMAPQLIAEIEKMESLEDIKMRTPEAPDLTERDLDRKEKLDKIDLRLCDAARGLNWRTEAAARG